MIDITDRNNCFYWQTDRNLTALDYERIFLHRQEISDDTLIAVLRRGIHSITETSTITIIPPDVNVKKGNVNIVRKITIDAKPYVVRMHPQGVKNGYFYTEQAALAAAHAKGIPVPQVMEIHEATDEQDMDFMLMTESVGQTMAIWLEQNIKDEDALLVDCGKQMAAIHSIRVQGFGMFDNNKAKVDHMLIGLHPTYSAFIHTGLLENLSRLVSFCVIEQGHADQMAQVFQTHSYEPLDGPRLVHNDFADWNLLTDGKSITAVLDWDECHAGDSIADLACWSTFFTMERMGKFMEGYKSIASLPKDYEERFHFYRLRYTISKMALRIKRIQVDTSPSLLERLNNGKQALKDETAWFGLG